MVEVISSTAISKISTDTAVEIDSKLPDTQLDVTKAITVEIQPENYVLTSGGIYTGNMTGAVPTWILNAIQQQLTTGDGNITSVLDDIKLLLDGLQVGVNQAISQIESTNASMSALETSVVSRLNGNDAAILDVYATKVTPTEAQAIAVQAIGSTFNGNVDAYIGNLASTYTDANSATATNIRTLQASYNEQTARIDTVEEVTISQGTAISILDTSVSSIVNTMLPELQSQIDGVINTWFYDGEPSLLNVPANSWLDDTTKLAHVGDLYYDKTTGYGYRFAYEDIVDDPDMGIIFSWVIISDVDVVKALADAAKAQDTVDGKRTIYGGATIPLPSRVNGSATIYVAEGDIWIPSANVASYVAGEVYRCTNPSSTPTVWVLATRYTQYVTDWITNTYAPAVSSIQMQIDKKAEIFYQSTSPRISYTNIPDNVTYNSYVGDLWKDTSSGGGHLEYIYTKTVNGGNFNYGWVETAIPDIIFDTIDGKASMYTTASLPTSYMVNDLMVVVGSKFNNGTTTYDVGVLLTATTTSISYSASHWTKKINDTEDLDAFVAVVNPKVDALKAQLDGSISYYFQLSTAALPSVAWTTDALKNTHHGDLLYFTDTKVAKRYSAQSNAWYDAADMTEVLAKIAASQATADGKATVYYKTTTEINAITAAWTTQQKLDNVGDVWIDSSTGVSKVWNTTAWVNIATVDANTALSKLADLEEARDGVVDTFYVTTAPASGMSYGDYWVDTDSWTGTAYVVYRYEALDGSSTGTLAWRVNRGETAVALGKAYRADVAGSAAFTAQITADTANTNATSAISKITDMASDNILSPVEKPSIVAEYSVITTEQSGIDSQAISYGITTEKTTYDTAISALTTYLTTLTSPVAWNTLTGDTIIVGTTFRGKFNDVYTTRQTLLNAITSKAKLLADTAQGTADGKVKTWYQAAAPTGLTASDVGDIWVDTDAGNLTKTWSGTAWVDIINTQSNTAYTWSANASKLITSPDGSVTGWSFGDGSNTKSNFKIKATNFSISDGTTGYTPFSIVGSKILFDGLVSFTNITGAPIYNVTYYQSAAPDPLLVNLYSGDIWYDTNDGNTQYRWNGSIWENVTLVVTASNSILRQTTAPLNPKFKDLWIDSDANNSTYWYDGTVWQSIDQDVATAINTNTTTINGNKITTGTVTANQIASNTITAANIAANTITATQIAVGTITANNIAASTITGSKISANTITAGNLAVIGLATFTNDAGYTKFQTYRQASTPAVAITGDLWIDIDDNNKIYRYNGSTWDSTTLDAAVAINTGTTLISGSKIVTGSITADKINTTGLIAENISATTIIGKTITGSTLNTTSFNLTNTANKNMAGVFYTEWTSLATYSNPIYTLTLTSTLYPYDSTNASKYRLNAATGNTLVFEDPTNELVMIPEGLTERYIRLCYTTGSITNLNLSVKCGTAVKESRTTVTADTYFTLNGIGFYIEQQGSNQIFAIYMKIDNTGTVAVSDTGSANPITISLSCYLNGTTDSYWLSGNRLRTFTSNL